MNRLQHLEQRAASLLDQRAVVTVIFSDHSRRSMPLTDVIPLLQGGSVAAISGSVGEENGQLLELIQAIIAERTSYEIQ